MIDYRQLQIEDFESYRLIRLECLRDFPENFGSSYEEEAGILQTKFPRLIADPENCFMFGAFDENILAGIVGFKRDERRKSKHKGEIVQMYVSPKYAGLKIGAGLLQRIIETAFNLTGIEQLELGVVSNNLRAIKLYETFGFKSFGVHHNCFKEGERYWHKQLMILSKTDYQFQSK